MIWVKITIAIANNNYSAIVKGGGVYCSIDLGASQG